MWDERGVLVHVSGRLVVLGVRESPRVEGDEEKGVHDEAHGVVELLRFGEGAVSALVCKNPNAGEDEALNGSICSPSREAKIDIGEERNVGDGEVDKGREVEVIAEHVCHRTGDRGFETVCWNGIVDFLHGEGG